MAEERLQKILARAGVASRRAAEGIITDGRVRVNGRVVTELGSKADSYRDKIELDGRRVVLEKPAYYIVHKPREMVTTLDDPEGRSHLGELLSKMPERVYPIGRLDYHTSGALLVTNDGDLTDALLHPRRKVPKVYAAKLRGHLGVPELDQLRNGVSLDDGYVTKAAEVFVIREEVKNTWIQLTLYEGKNRQIHRMADAIGHPVQRLVRLSFAGIDTDGLRPNESRPLNKREIEKLEKLYLRPAKIAKAADAAGEREIEERAALPSQARRRAPTRRKGPGARPGGPKPGGPKPGGAKTGGARTSGANADGPKPRGAKPGTGKPSAGRPRGAKPGAAKASGGKPRGAGPSEPREDAASDAKPRTGKGSGKGSSKGTRKGAGAGAGRRAARTKTGPGAKRPGGRGGKK